MLKVSKACVFLLAVIAVQLMVTASTAAFAFSFPIGTIVAGPGLYGSAVPASFQTYYAEGCGVNAAYGPWGPWGMGCAPFLFSPCGYSGGGQSVFATSFNSGGGCSPLTGLSVAGQLPLFSLSFF
jgi:hypothetical protein